MKSIVDPYGTSDVAGRKVAALTVGRSLSRFVFHLSQSALVGKGERFFGDVVGNNSPSQSDLAFQALESIFARCRSVFLDGEDICTTVQDVVEELSCGTCDEHFAEEMYRLRNELECAEEQDEVELRRTIVESVVSSPLARLVAAFGNGFKSEMTWLELGRKLEEGLCRPDVYRFQTPFMNDRSPVLRPDDYSTKCSGALASSDWTIHQHLDSTQNTVANIARVHVIRKPGDLEPQRLWWTSVSRRWLAAELEAEQLKILSKVRVDLRAATTSQDTASKCLIKCIEDLFGAAHFDAGKGLEQLRVNLEHTLVELNGVKFKVKSEIASIFFELKEAGGATSLHAIRKKYPMLFGEHDSLKRFIPQMPEPLSQILDHGKGKPIRLRL